MALAEKYAARDAEMGAPVPAPKPAPVASPPARRMRPGPIVAAVAAGALGVAALVNRDAIVAYVKGEPIGPDQPWAPPTATPRTTAATTARTTYHKAAWRTDRAAERGIECIPKRYMTEHEAASSRAQPHAPRMENPAARPQRR